jgi:hypothetical protein
VGCPFDTFFNAVAFHCLGVLILKKTKKNPLSPWGVITDGVLSGVGWFRPLSPRFLVVGKDTHYEDKNKTNNGDEGEANIHLFSIPIFYNAYPLTARFRQVKLFLAFGPAHR